MGIESEKWSAVDPWCRKKVGLFQEKMKDLLDQVQTEEVEECHK